MTLSSRCVKEIQLEEVSFLNFPWRYEIPKCLSNFIKKTPIKQVLSKNGNDICVVINNKY